MRDDPCVFAEDLELRRRAEDVMANRVRKLEADLVHRGLIHELEVREIELLLQNEDLRSARQELEAGLAEYTDFYDFAPLALFTLDRQGRLLKVNLAGAALLGLDRAELQDRSLSSFIENDDLAVYRRFFQEVDQHAGKASCEVALAAGRLPERIVCLEGALSADGKVCRAFAIDISARKRSERLIAEQLDELQRWREVTLGREDRIQELKREVNELLTKSGESPRYAAL